MRNYLQEKQVAAMRAWDEDNFVDVRHWDRGTGKTYLGMLCAYTEGLVKGNKVLVVSPHPDKYIFNTLDTVHSNLLGLSGDTGTVEVIGLDKWNFIKGELLLRYRTEYSLFVFDDVPEVLVLTGPQSSLIKVGLVYC